MKSSQIRCLSWSIFSCFWTEYEKIKTRQNTLFWHFSPYVNCPFMIRFLRTIHIYWPWKTLKIGLENNVLVLNFKLMISTGNHVCKFLKTLREICHFSAAKNEMKRRHQKDVSDAQSRPHQVVVLEKQQNEEKKVHMRIQNPAKLFFCKNS